MKWKSDIIPLYPKLYFVSTANESILISQSGGGGQYSDLSRQRISVDRLMYKYLAVKTVCNKGLCTDTLKVNTASNKGLCTDTLQ